MPAYINVFERWVVLQTRANLCGLIISQFEVNNRKRGQPGHDDTTASQKASESDTVDHGR